MQEKKQINTTTEKIAVIRQKTKLNPNSPVESPFCRTRHPGGPKKYSRLWKKNRFLASCSFRKNVLFEESPPSIMVTRNPNWSTEILWFGTGYVKGKILAPLKRSV